MIVDNGVGGFLVSPDNVDMSAVSRSRVAGKRSDCVFTNTRVASTAPVGVSGKWGFATLTSNADKTTLPCKDSNERPLGQKCCVGSTDTL